MSGLADLWHGRLPLAAAFWTWAVLIGATVTVVTTGASLAVLAAGMPGGLALAIHLLAAPYNLVFAVGVWRSAARHDGDPHQAQAARIAVIAWAVLLTLV